MPRAKVRSRSNKKSSPKSSPKKPPVFDGNQISDAPRFEHLTLEAQRIVVAVLHSCDTPSAIMAQMAGMKEGEFRAKFGYELQNGYEIATSMVARRLFNIAMFATDLKTSVPAAIFWLKARGRWSEVDLNLAKKPAADVPQEQALDLTGLTVKQIRDLEGIIKTTQKTNAKLVADAEGTVANPGRAH